MGSLIDQWFARVRGLDVTITSWLNRDVCGGGMVLYLDYSGGYMNLCDKMSQNYLHTLYQC